MALVKLKLLPRSTLTAKAVTRFVGQVTGGDGIDVTRSGGEYEVSLSSDALKSVAAHSYLGNNTGGPLEPQVVSNTQLTADLDIHGQTLNNLIDGNVDEIIYYDASTGGIRRTTISNATSGGNLGTMSTQDAADVNITGGAITGMPAPTNASDVATKSYVDAFSSGIQVGAAMRLATAAVLPDAPAYDNGTLGVGATLIATGDGALVVDGVTVMNGDRVLVKDQAAPAQNGVYTATDVGGVSDPYTLTRVTDFDTAAEMLSGTTFLVEAGTQAGQVWALQTTVATVGTSAVNFAQYLSAAGALLAANNLSDLADPSDARDNLGLGTIATQDADSVSITGGSATDLTEVTADDATIGTGTFTAITTDDITAGTIGSPRILKRRMSEQPSILDFDPDAGTGGDDTAAFHDATDYVDDKGGGVLLLPAFDDDSSRVYDIDTGVAPTNPVRFIGSGAGLNFAFGSMPASNLTKIVWSGGDTIVFDITNQNFGGGIKGIAIDCDETASVALAINSTCGFTVDDLVITNFKDYGIYMGATNNTCSWNSLRNISIQSARTNGNAALAFDLSLGVGNVCHVDIDQLRIVHAGTTKGIWLGGSDNIAFGFVYIYADPGTTGEGVYIDPTVQATFPNECSFRHLETSIAWVQPVGTTVSPGIVNFFQSPAPVLNSTPLTYFQNNKQYAGASLYNIDGRIHSDGINFPTSWSTNPAIKSGGGAQSIANGGNAIIAGGLGMAVVVDTTDQFVGLVWLAAAQTGIISDPFNVFQASTTPAGGKIGVAYDGGGSYRLYNNLGGTKSFSVTLIDNN